MNVDDLEETIAILSDAETLARIQLGERDCAAGDVVPWRDVVIEPRGH